LNKSGTFFEAGAADGEALSNTLLFELKYGWSGLLVEPNPDFFRQLLSKQRKSWAMNACISTQKFVEIVEFDASGVVGGIIKNNIKPSHEFYNVSQLFNKTSNMYFLGKARSYYHIYMT